jgi:hypothetical protein
MTVIGALWSFRKRGEGAAKKLQFDQHTPEVYLTCMN